MDERDEPLLNSDYGFVKLNRYKRRERFWACLSVVLGLSALALAVAVGVIWKERLPCGKKSTSSAGPISSSWLRVGVISDVHLDIQYVGSASALVSKGLAYPCHDSSYPAPFIAKFGRTKCDSPQELLESALEKIGTTEELDLLLVTGDKTAHFLYESVNGTNYDGTLVYDGQEKFAQTLAIKIPQRRVILTMGNNDVPQHWQIPEAWWYEKLWLSWSPLILCRLCEDNQSQQKVVEAEFNSTFLRGGYYKVQVANGLDFLVLNTLYWTKKAWQTTPFRRDNAVIASEQMQWLYYSLRNANQTGRKVVLVGHVPPGLDSHRHQLPSKKYEVKEFWFDNFTSRYMEVITNFSEVISGQLYAHMHKDDFHVLTSGNKGPDLPLLLMPAISPIYWNNPAFRYIYFERNNWQLMDYTQYWADFTEGNRLQKLEWKKDYTFSEAYPSTESAITGQRLLAIWKSIICGNETTWQTYTSHRQIYFPNDQNSFSRDHLYCVARSPDETSYNSCRKAHPYGPSS